MGMVIPDQMLLGHLRRAVRVLRVKGDVLGSLRSNGFGLPHRFNLLRDDFINLLVMGRAETLCQAKLRNGLTTEPATVLLNDNTIVILGTVDEGVESSLVTVLQVDSASLVVVEDHDGGTRGLEFLITNVFVLFDRFDVSAAVFCGNHTLIDVLVVGVCNAIGSQIEHQTTLPLHFIALCVDRPRRAVRVIADMVIVV